MTGDLADDEARVLEGGRLACAIDLSVFDLEHVHRDGGPEGDVLGGDDGRELGRDRRGVRLRAVAAAEKNGDSDERNDRQEHPDEQDKPIGTLQVRSPRVV